MNINPVNLDNMFDVISLSTEDDSGSNSDAESNDSDVDIDESNSSNENSGLDDASDEDIDEIMQQEGNDDEVGWETASETED